VLRLACCTPFPELENKLNEIEIHNNLENDNENLALPPSLVEILILHPTPPLIELNKWTSQKRPTYLISHSLTPSPCLESLIPLLIVD
jgi:hypothetical protein